MSEGQVSDVYVRLGNDFNAAVAAFAAFNIDMVCVNLTSSIITIANVYNSELMSVPDDLRNVLEQCLAEDATPENLEVYLPTVRQIITNLLQGLRGKQSVYRRIVSDHRHKSTSSEQSSGQQRISSRSSRTERTSRREGDGVKTHRSQLSRTISGDENPVENDSISRRSGQSTGRRKEYISQATSSSTDDETVVASDYGMPERSTTPSQSMTRRQPQPASPPLPALPPTRTRSASAADESIPKTLSRTSTPALPSDSEKEMPPPPPLPSPQVPASMKRYSLVDKPLSPPEVIIDESSDDVPPRMRSPSPEMAPLDSLAAPGMANSLAALKKSDVLERRASKRFSTYNISKITGSPAGRDRSLRSNHPNRRSLAASNTLTPGELNVLAEEDEEVSSPPSMDREKSAASQRSVYRTPPLVERETPSPLPHITPPPPPAVAPTREQAAEMTEGPVTAREGAEPSSSDSPQRSFPVFLQLGREVKKVTIEPGLSFSSLRVLFVDKFSYNPGLENFPAIYIRDPSSGVQYELEDMDEVKQKCLLSLNIERKLAYFDSCLHISNRSRVR